MKRIILFLTAITIMQSFNAQNGSCRLLIGTYTNTGKSQGIYSYKVNVKKDIYVQNSVTSGVSNPSYLAITPDKKFVYAVNESGDNSAVSAFQLNQANGELMLINRSLTQGADPCHISVSAKHVFTANYSGGSISVFGRNADGSLTDILQKIQHVGKSINTVRQNEPHVHQVILSPDEKYLLATDLGTDKVTVYKYNQDSKSDILVAFDTLDVKPGSGPRHAVFGKDGKKLYILQELDGTVSVCDFMDGRLTLVQESTVVTDKSTTNGGADIQLSPDGRFLYATNRGTANTISCFKVHADGTLHLVKQLSTMGKGPRNFAITPNGKYLFVANQNTDNIVIFERNSKSGMLYGGTKQLKVGAPVCLKFID